MAKPKPTKTFHIVQTDKTFRITFDVTLETGETKFKSFEQLMICITKHYLDKGRVDDIEWLLGLLQSTVESHKECMAGVMVSTPAK